MSWDVSRSLRACLAGLASLVCAFAPTAGCGGTGERAVQSESASTAAECRVYRDTAAGRPAVYFSPFDDPEQQVLCLLDRARHEVLVAHYNIRRENVIAKLVELHRRGVDVRVAVDEENAAAAWNVGDTMMEEAGIPVVRTKPKGSGAIMHLKATVIDGATLMTGSLNWNETAALANDENMLVLSEREVVDRYRRQILEVLGERERTVEEPRATSDVAVYFCPEQETESVIVDVLDAARTSIDVAMFSFTNKVIGEALVRAAARGVAVRMILEKKQATISRVDEAVESAGVHVVRGANTVGRLSAMHQKYAVIDGARVVTGATNWSGTGTRANEEDLLVVDDLAVTAAYRRNFADLMAVYGGEDITAEAPDVLASRSAGVLFNPVTNGTADGERVVVVGSDPALGSWDVTRAIDARTHRDMFPSWTAVTHLPAGARVEYKFVIVAPDGSARWEEGPNRTLDVPVTGRASVESGEVGDTSSRWTPRNPRT